MALNAANVQTDVINAKFLKLKGQSIGPTALVLAKLHAQNAIVIIHVLNAALDIAFLRDNVGLVKVIVINVILLPPKITQATTSCVLVHAKEAVMHAVMGIPALDVNQDTSSITESAMLAMIAVNVTLFKLVQSLTELNVLLLLLQTRIQIQVTVVTMTTMAIVATVEILGIIKATLIL